MHYAPVGTLFAKPGMVPIPMAGAKIYNLVSKEKTRAAGMCHHNNGES